MFTTKPLTPDTWDDFAELVEANNGVWGGCWCMGFHPEGVGAGRTREGNREAKRGHTVRGSVHQMLVYDDDGACVGWCQYGSPAELPNIKNPAKYEQGSGSSCRTGGSAASSPGASTASAGSLGPPWPARWRRSGPPAAASWRRIRSRPIDRKPQRGSYLHTGPEELFTEFGFVRDRQIAKWRWVMRAEV